MKDPRTWVQLLFPPRYKSGSSQVSSSSSTGGTEPRSRGSSPPEKRARPPERSYSVQDRYASTERQSLVSPPPSRKSSLAALPANVPTGPRRPDIAQQSNPSRSRNSPDAADRRLPNGLTRAREDLSSRRPSAGHSPLHVMSPGSAGSGGSAPVHGVAPLVPSMLPRAASASTRPATVVPSQGLPITLATLQNLKLRKQALANEAKAKHGDKAPASTAVKIRRDRGCCSCEANPPTSRLSRTARTPTPRSAL